MPPTPKKSIDVNIRTKVERTNQKVKFYKKKLFGNLKLVFIIRIQNVFSLQMTSQQLAQYLIFTYQDLKWIYYFNNALRLLN